MAVVVLDKQKRPLMPCSEKRARLLLARGRAVVHRLAPFTIRLLRHRPARFDNRARRAGWLPPSLQHRVDTQLAWTNKLCRLAPITGRERILAQARRPLRDATAENATRWALYRGLTDAGLPVEVGTGGRTKWNRAWFGVPKAHALDAACAGDVEELVGWQRPTLGITATGRGAYQRTRLSRFGFPRGYLMRQKQVHGFQTGDQVRAEVPSGRHAGIHAGRVAVRATGSFNIQTPSGVVQGIHHRHCRIVQRGDGYGYFQLRKLAGGVETRLVNGAGAPCAIPRPA